MLLNTHRQAWCWQDEYVDLTINEVRLLEAETQEILNEKMRVHNNSQTLKNSNSKSSFLSKEKCNFKVF